jgi:hypothetical protein
MPTPSSGQISLSDVATIVYNSSTSEISLGNSEVRIFANDTVGDISLSSAYNKPLSGNTGTTYNTPGSYSFIVPGYQTLTANVAGAGGAGGGYTGGQWFYNGYFFQCVNKCNGTNGTSGGQTDFNGVIAYGGGGGITGGGNGAAGGNNLNANTGGGGAGGAGNTNPVDTNCEQASGGNGGAGGFAAKSWTKAVTSGHPSYGSTINFTVGSGGTSNGGCRGQAGGPGGNGYVYIAWS